MTRRFAAGSAPVRVWLVGFGTVGRWLARALDEQRPALLARYGVEIEVVGLANARDGFVSDDDGLDLRAALDTVTAGRSLADLPRIRAWPTALAGMRATDADVLVEVTASPSTDAEPGLSHMREALRRRIDVVTANKWPVALHGTELLEQAGNDISFRAESTVMSGTPVLSSLTDGMGGAVPLGVRGLLNATTNEILSRMSDQGLSYRDALAAAQGAGLAESDPAADVEGDDSVAKVMILSALVFGRQLRRDEVTCRGITDITTEDIDRAASRGHRIKHVSSLEFAEAGGHGAVVARVELETVPAGDLLAHIDGATNVVTSRSWPIGETTIIGPGAGMGLAGQGVLSDLIAVVRARRGLGG